jgi:pimeloyl-ACP methyl ester carboxylesterase
MSNRAQPLYFPSGDQTLFGWLHAPTGPVISDVGAVICSPFGYEAVCAHLSLRAFADTCAASGVVALRFDYFATGDSSGTVAEDDLILKWRDDIGAAIDTLRRTLGVRRICLVGVRLGALLAGLVAVERPIDALVAITPVVSGRRYLRELRAFLASTSVNVESAAPSADGGLDVAGFRLSNASLERLDSVDLSKLNGAAPTSVLIIDRDDFPAAQQWAAALKSSGADVRYEALPGFSDMVTTPHAATVPVAMTEAMAKWLGEFEHRASSSRAATISAALPADASMYIQDASGVDLVERPVFIDGERTVFAIVTERAGAPLTTASSGYGVVMLNGGATYHIGPNRMYVELSRRWAAMGYVVMRLDLAGLGDSDPHPGQPLNQVYPPNALDDVGAAIDFLRVKRGIASVTLAGLCAGAYHALRSAISGLPVDTVLMVNPLTFHWEQGSTLSDLQIAEVVRNPGVYAEHARSLRKWSKLLRGHVNVWRVFMVFLRRAGLAIDSSRRELSRALRIRLRDDLGWDLESIAARGVRIVFLFAPGDGGLQLLRLQGGSALKRLGDRCRVHLIEGADHIFTQRPARMKLQQLLTSELPSSGTARSAARSTSLNEYNAI